jgi:hypothetical protein
LGWALYRDRSAPGSYLDLVDARRRRRAPFRVMPPAKDVPLEVPPQRPQIATDVALENLDRIHRALQTVGRAISFRRGFLNLNLMLGRLLQLPVRGLRSDDEGLDFACQLNSGVLIRIRFECVALGILYENGIATV